MQRAIPILPVLLIAFGAHAILREIFGRGISVFPLAIGIYLLMRSNRGGHYPLLVVGAVLTGVGAGNLIGDIVGGGTGEAIGTLGTASGFFWLANTDRGRSNWALIPAAIIGLIAVGEFGLHINELVNGGSWLVPAGVIVAGILLLGAHRLPGPLRLAGIVFVGAAALSLIANGNDRGPAHRGAIGAPRAPLTATTSAPRPFELGSHSVRIHVDNGSVLVTEGDPTVVVGTIDETNDKQVTIRPRVTNGAVVVAVPAGTHLDISSNNGSITVQVATADVVAHTDNGAITLTLSGHPTVDADTDSGRVTVDGRDEGHGYADPGTAGKVEAHSDNGQIVITHTKETAEVGAGQR
jgi:hypothetical protein